MAGDSNTKIYLANALFSEADRDFNAKCAMLLRNAGYHVFLPQEATENKPAEELSPLAENIFRVDTSEILDSHLLVACIDQETIDCGVACEIGIAFSYGIPIIGLYTDIRQHRQGPNRMYKNPYVIGAIEAFGEIVEDVNYLLQVIPKYLHIPQRSKKLVSRHFDSVASGYSEFISRLESWYTPSWDIKQVVDKWFQTLAPKRIFEFGCGTGDIGEHISRQYPDIFYLGYDNSPSMIQIAEKKRFNMNCLFTTSWIEVKDQVKTAPFDIVLTFFTLHDIDNAQETVSRLAQCLQTDGIMLITDLSKSDLPKLTNLLRRKLARPLYYPDNRIDPVRITKFVEASNLAVVECSMSIPLISFPSADDLDEYLEFFGIYYGMDLPLAIKDNAPKYCHLIRQVLRNQNYPYIDQRALITCALRRL